ncbi:MAG: phosphatase PAP2 family protein [Planctomycetes bacterium]|nr:phosphatase PAP2 family protein [Planctomycetota bacterium]
MLAHLLALVAAWSRAARDLPRVPRRPAVRRAACEGVAPLPDHGAPRDRGVAPDAVHRGRDRAAPGARRRGARVRDPGRGARERGTRASLPLRAAAPRVSAVQSGASWRSSVPLALLWRYGTHSLMVAIALWNERRAAPPLPDLVLDHVPRVEWIAAHNYHLWLALYLPLALALWRRDRRAFVHFLWLGGFLSLARGLCVPLTGLGPAHGADLNAGASPEALRAAWIGIVNPFTALSTDVPHLALTKDLFFSGHVSTTFLLWLYVRRDRVLGPLALVAHVLVTASVFLAHLHYSIDVVAAWAVTFALWTLARARWPAGAELEPPPA